MSGRSSERRILKAVSEGPVTAPHGAIIKKTNADCKYPEFREILEDLEERGKITVKRTPTHITIEGR